MTNRFSKSILVLAAAALLGSGSVYAGNGPGDCDGSGDGTCTEVGGGNGSGKDGAGNRRGGPAERMAGMANRLGLTLEQQVQALELFDAHAQERAQIQARIFEDYGTEICDQRALHREEFRAMLNEDQQALFDGMQNRRGSRAGQGGGPGGFECPNDDG